jgi:metal-responsive CopG/Arc/MetJ family transcriptional regulator
MKPSHITFSLTPELLKTIDERARAEKMNRSRYIVQALEAYTSGVLSVDMTSSYSPDNTKVLHRMSDLEHENSKLKDIIIQAQRETIVALGESRGSPTLEAETETESTHKKSWFARHFGKKE